MIYYRNFSLLRFLQTNFTFYFWLKSSTSSSKHSSKHSLPSSYYSSPITIYIRLETFPPGPSVTLFISTSVLLTLSSVVCFVCDTIASMIILVLWHVKENTLLFISSCRLLIIVPFIDLISNFNPSISDISRIYVGMLVNSGVPSVLF